MVLLLTACRYDMRDQPRYEPFEQSAFFADQASARPRVADTVARGHLRLDDPLTTGRADGKFVQTIPTTMTLALVERGQERYAIFCAPCHGLVGEGDGIVIDYGMRQPDSFHLPDLRDQPDGYYFSVITEGTNVMPSYASRISIDDRWAIIAYIRALQLSQNANAAQLPPDALPVLEQTTTITQ